MEYKEIAGRIAILENLYDVYGFSDAFGSMEEAVNTFLYGLINFPEDIKERLTEIAKNPDAMPEEKTEANALIKML